jgi:hypothetical protein
MSTISESPFKARVPEQVPVLTKPVPEADVPLALSLALEARLAEKKALMNLSDQLIVNLKPDLERLTAELVQKALVGLWEKRCEKYQNH